MPPPVYTSTDYLFQFQRLLPRGRVWHRGWGLVQDAVLLTLMPTWVRLHAWLSGIIAEAFPCSTVALLPEWEATLGLPDPCTGPLPTLQQRQQAVCTKFAARGGQSLQYFEDLAASLGYTVTIKEFAPFRASINRAEDRVYGAEWAHTWAVIGPMQTVTYFRASISRAGEPLATWGNVLLECVIRAYAPAHTIVLFEYPTETVWDRNETIWDGGATIWDYRGPPVGTEETASIWLRLPLPVRNQFLERARAAGVPPAEFFARVWQSFIGPTQ